MGMMDYLIGKNVGRTEGKNSGASQADVDSAYAVYVVVSAFPFS